VSKLISYPEIILFKTMAFHHDHRKNIRQGIQESLKKCLYHDEKTRVLDDDSTQISFVDKLFDACRLDLVPAALSSNIINGMDGKGTLFPDTWGSYMVQDVVYLYKCVENFKLLHSRATTEYQQETSNIIQKQFAHDMADFACSMITVFNDAYVDTANQWQIISPSAIQLGVAVENYSAFQDLIFASPDIPLIYAAIVMIPCERLWQELAVNFMKQDDGNLYAFWIENNATYTRVIEHFVNQEYKKISALDGFQPDIFFNKALSIYRGAMQGEVNFFNTAGNPSEFQPIPIPSWVNNATVDYRKTKLSFNPAYIHLLHQHAIDNFIPRHGIIHPRSGACDNNYVLTSTLPETSPSTDSEQSLFGELLWKSVMLKNYPDDAYRTTFIQGIQNVNLRPNNYGAYMIQDAIYLLRASKYFLILNNRANEEITNEEAKPLTDKNDNLINWYKELATFAYDRATSYNSYWENMKKTWNIKNPDEIRLNEAVTAYLHLQRDVFESKKVNLIHCLIVMIPCERLWPWLGRKADTIMTNVLGDNKKDTLYYFWINDNARLDKNPPDPYFGKIETKVNNLYSKFTDEEKTLNFPIAEKIYELATLGEVNFFTSANPDIDTYVIPPWLKEILQNHID